jgi:energy-converting hydrogenase Eha subunit H
MDFELTDKEKKSQVIVNWVRETMIVGKIYNVKDNQMLLFKELWTWLDIIGKSAIEPFYLVFSDDYSQIKKRERV